MGLKAGEPWVFGDKEATDITCCDCGLVHKVIVDIDGKKATLRFYRDDYRTERIRKKEGIVIYERKVKIKAGD